MGDMADHFNECIENDYENYIDYTQGRITDLEAYDLGIIDKSGNIPSSVSYKTCKYCGKSGLVWGNTDKGWRLFDGNIQHRCNK